MMYSELYLLMYCPGIYLSIQTNQTLIYNNLRLEHYNTGFQDRTNKKFQMKARLFSLICPTDLFMCLHLSAVRIWSSDPRRALWPRRQH